MFWCDLELCDGTSKINIHSTFFIPWKLIMCIKLIKSVDRKKSSVDKSWNYVINTIEFKKVICYNKFAKLNKKLLSREVEGKGPMKPGNLLYYKVPIPVDFLSTRWERLYSKVSSYRRGFLLPKKHLEGEDKLWKDYLHQSQ